MLLKHIMIQFLPVFRRRKDMKSLREVRRLMIAPGPARGCGHVPVTLWGVGGEGEKCRCNIWKSSGNHKKSDSQVL